MLENVPQVHGAANKDSFDDWCNFLLDLGYNNKWCDLNAKDFGVPQNRERTFMVSWLGDYYFDFPTGWKLTKKLRDVLEDKVDEKYYLSDKTISSLIDHKNRNEEKGNGFGWKPKDGGGWHQRLKQKAVTDQTAILLSHQARVWNGVKVMQKIKIPQATKCGEIEVSEYGAFDMSYPNSKTRRGRVQGGGNLSPTLTAQHNEIGVVEPMICAVRGREQEDGKLRQKLELNPGATSNSLTTVQKDNLLCEPIALDEQNRCLRKDGTVGTLTTDGSSPKHNNRVVEPFVRGSLQKHASERKDGICPTLTEAMGMGGGQVPVHNYDYRIRKLTPRECWRLMGFSDEDFDRAQSVNSDSQLYKQAGNSIVVDVLAAIFGRML